MVDEELLMAHLDGEVDLLTADRVAKAVAENPKLRALADEQAKLRDLLAGHFNPIVDEEIPPRLRTLLETNVVPLPAPRVERRPRVAWRAWGAIAASFVVGLVAAQMIPQRAGPAGMTGDGLVASGALASALDTRLASEQSAAETTRIGVSFAAKDGRMCRTFETRAMAGLACRDGDGWQVLAHDAARPRPGGEYRQASSGTALIMRISQELMKGEPFDARAEREARDKGWRPRR